MSIPGGIRVKLALALLGIVGGALLVAYAVVVPSLERRLVQAKLEQLQTQAENWAVQYSALGAQDNLSLSEFVSGAGLAADSRVAIFAVQGSPGRRSLVALADSASGGTSGIERDPTALDAAENVRIVREP
jgi:hypothetical protein